MSLQKVLAGVTVATALGLGIAQVAVASPLPQQPGNLLVSQTITENVKRVPARINRIYGNATYADVELLTTGEIRQIDIETLGVVDARQLTPGDYVVITYDGGTATAMETISEDEANALLADLEADTTASSEPTSETVVESETTIRRETTVQRPTPAPAPASAPAQPRPVRALW